MRLNPFHSIFPCKLSQTLNGISVNVLSIIKIYIFMSFGLGNLSLLDKEVAFLMGMERGKCCKRRYYFLLIYIIILHKRLYDFTQGFS